MWPLFRAIEILLCDCINLLQLKLYAESLSSLKRAKITDSYRTKAYDKAIFISTVRGNSRQLLIITICTSIATTVIATLIVLSVGMLIFCTNHGSFMESKCMAKLPTHNPAIISLTFVSILLNIYMFCSSWIALSAWEQSRDNTLLSDLLDFDEINYINRTLIGFLIVFNTISLFCSVIVVGIVAGLICIKNNLHDKSIEKLRMLRLVSVIFTCLSICAHSPYIAIAFLNNEYFATGVFIYYTLLSCLLFGLSWIAFHYYYSIPQSKVEMNDSDNGSCFSNFLQSSIKFCKHKFLIIVALFFIIFLTHIFIVILNGFFLVIPISNSISEFPNRIAGIYMSGGFIISTFFVYKLVVYLCRKNKHNRVNTNDFKLEETHRNRSKSERMVEEYIILEKIKDGIQNLNDTLNKHVAVSLSAAAEDQVKSDAQHEDQCV